MKKLIVLLYFASANLLSNGQCSTVAVQVSSSDTNRIQLYNAGFFNIPSGFANVCEWTITSFSDEIIYQETTSGDFNDQSRIIFDHSIPITDSMKAVIVITNDVEGITCTMKDTLYWKETEVLSGSFIGNWEVLSSNGGVEQDIVTSTILTSNNQNIALFPSPMYDHFEILSDQENHSFSILDINGQILAIHNNYRTTEKVDVSDLSSGTYFVHFWDSNKRNIAVKKIVKM